MSHYYASIQGQRKERTCCGTKSSGITGHIRGWNIGARVDIEWDEQRQLDVVSVYKTKGTNGGSQSKKICSFTIFETPDRNQPTPHRD